MIYKLALGDWSEDGHGISEDFLFECNYDVHKIRQAYKDSCRKLGVTFNYNEDYTELGLKYGSERQVWTEYRDDGITRTAFEILNEAGCFDEIDYYEDRDKYYLEYHKDCAKLIMNFIALSLPEDFAYKLIERQDYECINGYWNDELNHQFGYGLFD